MRKRVLVVARDATLRADMARVLMTAGHAVELAEGTRRAHDVIAGTRIDLGIIAQGLLEDVGPAQARQLADAMPGVMVLTDQARRDPERLLAEVDAALRSLGSVPAPASPRELQCFEGLTLDLAGHAVSDADGREIALTRAEFGLLSALAHSAGRVLSRDQLRQALDGRGSDAYDRSIDVMVLRLRRKIEPDPRRPRFIVTVPGVGYKFVALPRPAPPVATEPSAEGRQVTAPHPAPAGGALAWAAALLAHQRVGGEVELARLQHSLDQLLGGGHGFAVLVGEAGVGKSRLAAEIATRAAAAGASVALGRCHENEQIFPFAPWIEALRSTGATEGDLDPLWRLPLSRLLPELAGQADPPTDATTDHFRLFEAVVGLLARLAARRPLLLLLEDLHWADSMSLRLLGFLGRRLPATRILVLATVRQEMVADNLPLARLLAELARDQHALDLTLPRLSRDASRTLLLSLLPTNLDAARRDALEQAAWNAAEGNPFMLREIAQACGEGVAPEADRAAATLPPRVRAVVSGRLDRLGKDAQGLASLLSVIGRGADHRLLLDAAGMPEDRGVAALEALVERQILRGVGDGLEFTHDAIRRVAYDKLLAPRRALLHRRVAAALARHHAGAPGDASEALGYHYLQAATWREAAQHLHQAGRRAVSQAAYGEAVQWLEQALAALRRLPRDQPVQALEADIRVALYLALVPDGHAQSIGEHLASAADCAAAVPDAERLGWIKAYQANFLWMSGRYLEAVASGEHAAAIAAERGDPRLAVASGFYLGQVHHYRGDYQRAGDMFARNLAALTPIDAREQCGLPGVAAVLSRGWLLWSLAEVGQSARLPALAEETIALAVDSDHGFTMADAFRAVGCAYLRAGQREPAVAVLERGLALCHRRELALWTPSLAAALGHAYACCDRAGEAIPLLQQSLAQTASLGIAAGHAQRTGWLADALLKAGEIEAARRTAAQALTLAEAHQERGHQAWILSLSGEIARREGRRGAEERERRAALAIGTELGLEPLLARI